MFRALGNEFSTRDGSLLLQAVSPTTAGEDNLGSFEETTCTWNLGAPELAVQTQFKVYPSLPAIVFTQLFPPEGLSATALPDRNLVSTAFPAWQRNDALGFLSYNGDFVKYTNAGRWTNGSDGEDAQIASGLSSGPTVFLLASEPSTVLVTSAFSSFMVSSQLMDDDVLSVGLLGSIAEIPATNYSASTILTLGEQGVGAAIAQWGSILRSQYNKPARGWERDDSTQWLGYATQNGAYFYYLTEPGKSYQQTLLDVWTDAQQQSIPYSTILLDSWWYFKGEIGGVKNWTARPDIFPDGIQSLRTTGFRNIIAHNRYWSADTDYALQNGGDYEFIVDPVQHSAMPQSEAFWDALFAQATQEWGLKVYEQDWLYNEFEGVAEATSDVTVAERWLTQMARAASRAGVTLQYCMPWPRHLLQSVAFPSVTQARASDDYQPSTNEQWKIGLSSLLYSALGLAPYKDNFWTTQYQPGNPYGGYNEPHPALESAVASWSLGPVTIGDDIGRSNRALIMKSCRADGRLLQPDHPPFALDSQIAQAALGTKDPASGALGPQGQLWITSTSLQQDAPAAQGLAWFALLAANLTESYSFTVQELAAQELLLQSDPATLRFVVWSWTNASSFSDPVPEVLSVLTAADPLTVASCGLEDFSVYYLSPLWAQGWSLLGEWSKWTVVSRSRVRSVEVDAAQVAVQLLGAPGEVAELAWSDAQSAVHATKCMLDDEGGALIVLQTPAASSPLQYTCSTDTP